MEKEFDQVAGLVDSAGLPAIDSCHATEPTTLPDGSIGVAYAALSPTRRTLNSPVLEANRDPVSDDGLRPSLADVLLSAGSDDGNPTSRS